MYGFWWAGRGEGLTVLAVVLAASWRVWILQRRRFACRHRNTPSTEASCRSPDIRWSQQTQTRQPGLQRDQDVFEMLPSGSGRQRRQRLT